MSDFRARGLATLKAKIAAIEASGRQDFVSLPFGDVAGRRPPARRRPAAGRWHEFAGEGLELETAAAPRRLRRAPGRAAGRRGELIWVLRRDDLYAPGLAGLGFPAERLIQVCARDEAEALAVMEDALRTPGVAAVVGEADRGRSRRRPAPAAGLRAEPGHRFPPAPSAVRRRGARDRLGGRHPLDDRARAQRAAAGEPGLGAPRWRVRLERCRGGRTGAWILEAGRKTMPRILSVWSPTWAITTWRRKNASNSPAEPPAALSPWAGGGGGGRLMRGYRSGGKGTRHESE